MHTQSSLTQLPTEDEQLTHLKSRFFQTISREFHASLAMIQLSSQLLANYGDTWDKETKLQHIHRIQTTVDYMTQLLEQTLHDIWEDD